MDIKFDEMTVDTSLAQKYLEQEKDLLEVYKNKVSTKSPIELKKDISNQGVNIIKKLKTLVGKILQNADLISQLEYLIRKIPIEDTKAQLNIICHHLRSYTPIQDPQDIDGMYNPDVPIYSDDPLLIFGSIKNIQFSLYVMFHTTKTTAYVAQLFVQLCHESGLESIKLEFTDEKNLPLRTNLNINGWNSGTVAVVSEDADVDSAVDKFLTSSIKAPWRLRKILVQETIYQQFKDTLSWKCNLKRQITEALAPNVMCAHAFTYDGKTFLIDPVEISKDQQSVTVEAYRTRKEMISFLQKDKIQYLSLWCNGIAEINEVAYSTVAPVVWVNNLADFRGPPTISEAIFNKFDEIKIEKCPKIAKLSEVSKIWQSKPIEYRRGILASILDKMISMVDAYVSDEVAKNSREAIADCSMKSFVDVGNDYVCIGKSYPVGVKLISSDFLYTPTSFKSLLYGNGLAVIGDLETRMFEEAGVPVISLTPVVNSSGVNVNCVLDTRTRVIWTNSGTIFAN